MCALTTVEQKFRMYIDEYFNSGLVGCELQVVLLNACLIDTL